MLTRRASGRLLFLASLLFAAGLLLSIFLTAGLATVSAQAMTPSLGAAPASDQPEPFVTAAGAYTVYLAVIHSAKPIVFYDSFNNPASGWPIHNLNLAERYPPGPWSSGYGKEIIDPKRTGTGNVYNVKTAAAWNSWIYTAPVVLADPAQFDLQIDGKSAQNSMWASSWGLYFNANADRTQLYTFQISQDSDGESFPTLRVRRWDYFQGDSDDPNVILVQKVCKTCARADFGWTQIRVERRGSSITVYAGGKLRASLYAPQYTDSAHNGVGVYQGNFEWNDFSPKRYGLPTFQFDNFIASPVFVSTP